jgi:hypothetical protein
MADGSLKKIKDIVAGDSVYNPVSKAAVKVKSILESSEENPMVLVEAGSYKLKVTQGHPVYVVGKGNVKAIDLKEGHILLDHSGAEVKISKLIQLPLDKHQTVINLTLEGGSNFDDHMLIANGLHSGDLYVQQNLPK